MTRPFHKLDLLVRDRLSGWPHLPPGLEDAGCSRQGWVRGRPNGKSASYQPFLKLPGSRQGRTLPDGLWLCFAGTPEEIFVDIFAVEACGSLANLLDKRSRFAPSTHSLMAVCPVPWLLAPISADDPTPRWVATGVLRAAPALQLVVPVRDLRVLYGLKRRHYAGFVGSQVPHPHEYFVPMDALTDEHSANNPALRRLVARASAASNFLPLVTPPAGV